MTFSEAILGLIQSAVPANSIELACLNQGYLHTEAYTLDLRKPMELAALECMEGLLTSPDISEGGYSIKFDRSAIQKKCELLGVKYGLPAYVSTSVPNAKFISW